MNQRIPPANNWSGRGRSGRSNSTGRGRGRDQERRQCPAAQGMDSGVPVTYCWSHGITQNLWHNSRTCTRTITGHKNEATYDNKMGGSTQRCSRRS